MDTQNNNVCAIASKLFSEEFFTTVKQKNLKLKMVKSVGVLNTRGARIATWVGVDILINDALRVSGSDTKKMHFADFVEKYFAATNKNSEDYYCWGVKNDGTNRFLITELHAQWTYKANGIIFISKSDISDMYAAQLSNSDEDIEDELFAKARAIVRLEVDLYSSWLNGGAYDVTFSTQDNSISHTFKQWQNIDGVFDDLLKKGVSIVSKGISQSKSAMKLNLIVDMSNFPHQDPVPYILEQLEEQIGVKVTVGDTSCDYQTGETSITILADDLPRFQDIVDQSGFYIINLMAKNCCQELGFESLETWAVVEMLMNPEPFSEWLPVMQNALLKSLFSSIAYTKLVSADFCNLAKQSPKKEIK